MLDRTPTLTSDMRRLPVLAISLTLLAGAVAWAAQAHAQGPDRWIADETQARAVLPAPVGGGAVNAVTLICAEQRWTFHLALEHGARPADGDVTISVDRQQFVAEAAGAPGAMEIAVPFEALDPLKRGLRLTFSFDSQPSEQDMGEPVFSLIGSRVAITAMEDVCSRPDMSAYRKLTFTPYSSHMSLARKLRADDMAAFRLATSSEPELSVAMAQFGDGRRALFTRLCGSSWYYGVSGCNVTGFAPGADEGEWRIVYDSEGVSLYIDHASDEYGWPDLVTLPLRARGEPSVWYWSGEGYRLRDGGS